MENQRAFVVSSLRVFTVCALFVIILATSASAQKTTYTYTGNAYTQFPTLSEGTGVTCPPMCKLTGSFTVSQPLGYGYAVEIAPPYLLSFTFTDGLSTITNLNATPCCGASGAFGFVVGTNSQGQINSWNIGMTGPPAGGITVVIQGVYYPDNPFRYAYEAQWAGFYTSGRLSPAQVAIGQDASEYESVFPPSAGNYAGLVEGTGAGNYGPPGTWTSGLSITTASLPNGTVGTQYPETTVAATGGTAPYSWSASGLPSGLSIDPSSGIISGTPTESGTFTATISVNDSTGLTASKHFPLTMKDTCPASNIVVGTGGNLSNNLRPTSVFMAFTPPATGGMPTSLGAAAKACGFLGFDWQQTIDNFPAPNPLVPCNLNVPASPKNCSAAISAPTTPLSAPPTFLDPVQGGYTYELPEGDDAFPFYYEPIQEVSAQQDQDILLFQDTPTYGALPPGQYMEFTTSLVGVADGYTPSKPLATVTWVSDFNGTSGGVARTKNSSLADPGSGTGGVRITSINGVPQTPPSVTCTATPNALWPPNGKSVLVTVSGSLTAGTSALTSATYAVLDSYGQVQPSGSITLGAGGSYSFGIPLIAKRNGTDLTGRTYTIYVKSGDTIGNVGSCSAVVTVPHDQGH